jgi:pilus assembly protein Flp/PilA
MYYEGTLTALSILGGFAPKFTMQCRWERNYCMLYLPRQEGQGLVEYALILVLVAVVVIVILSLTGTQIANIFSNIVATL